MPEIQSIGRIFRRVSHRLARGMASHAVRMINAAPLVSITFDDCPASAVREGAHILERHGVLGTFYVSGGLAGRPWENGPQFDGEDLKRLVAAGHEVGCHTYNHSDCATLSKDELATELMRNRTFFDRTLPGYSVESFAYPYGRVGLSSKHFIQSKFLACRGVQTGINVKRADLGLLKAVALPQSLTQARWLEPWLNQLIESNGWLILFSHDVSSQPTAFGCQPDVLESTVATIRAAGIDILPVRHAVRQIGAHNVAEASRRQEAPGSLRKCFA